MLGEGNHSSRTVDKTNAPLELCRLYAFDASLTIRVVLDCKVVVLHRQHLTVGVREGI